MNLDLEAHAAFAASHQADDALAASDGGEPDVLPFDVVCHQAIHGVVVLVLQSVEKRFYCTDVVEVGSHWRSLVGHVLSLWRGAVAW
jgi:hypothetical protein